MFHLADESTLERMEGALRRAREYSDSVWSWWWNVILLVGVLASFGFFLYARRGTPVREEKRIPFEPTTWYSAARNIRSEEYGAQLQPFAIEARNGLPGIERGGSEVAI